MGKPKKKIQQKCFVNLFCSRRDCVRMVVGFIITLQSVPINTNIVSSNPDHVKCTRYNIM